MPSNKRARLGDGKKRAAKFAAFPGFVAGPHFAAQLLRHHLLAITNAKDRQAAVKQHLRRAGAAIVGHRGGRAGENDTLGLHPVKRFFGHRVWRDFGIHAGLAHAARDQLRYLTAEIDNQDGIGEVFWLHQGELRALDKPVQPGARAALHKSR